MSQISKAMLVVIFIVLLFNFAGLIGSSNTGVILGQLGVLQPQDLPTTTFWIAIKAIFTFFVLGAGLVSIITIGSLRGGSPVETAKEIGAASVGILMIALGEDIFLISGKLWEVNPMFGIIVGTTLGFAYIMGVLDWYRKSN